MSHSIIARDFRGTTLYLAAFADREFNWSADSKLAYRFESAAVASQWLDAASRFCVEGRFFQLGVRANGELSGIRERITTPSQQHGAYRTDAPATHSAVPHSYGCICIRCHDSAQGLSVRS